VAATASDVTSRGTAVALVAALAIAAPAAAAFKRGSYTGTTDQGLAVSFKAGKKYIRAFEVKEQGACSDGRVSRGTQGPFKMRIKRHGKFGEVGTSPTGATRTRVTGKLKGQTASGTLRVTSRFNDLGQPDPKGSIICKTGTVHWTATRG
jgi:hypothetical protein